MSRSAEYDSDIAKMYGTAKPSLVFSFNEDQSVGVVIGVGKAYYPPNEQVVDPDPVDPDPVQYSLAGLSTKPLSFKPLGN